MMIESQPTMEFGGRSTAATQYDAPTLGAPPSVQAGRAPGDVAVAEQTPPAATAAAFASPPQAAPSLPTTAGSAVTAVTAWQSNKQFNALWSINQDRNSWVGVVGVGWKKLSSANETATSGLTMLAAHAREKNSPVDYREEADGMIHEIYVW